MGIMDSWAQTTYTVNFKTISNNTKFIGKWTYLAFITKTNALKKSEKSDITLS